MNRLALTCAVIGLFVLAFVAWLGGCTPFTCATRGLIGAVVIFVAARLGLKLLVAVVADTMARSETSREPEGKRSSQ